MLSKKTPRQVAIDEGKARYAMTKPCSKGHLGERYASCGACVQCSDERQADIAQRRKAGRILANTKLFEPARVWSGLVRSEHHGTFEQLARVFACGTDEQVAQVAAFIYMINQQVREL